MEGYRAKSSPRGVGPRRIRRTDSTTSRRSSPWSITSFSSRVRGSAFIRGFAAEVRSGRSAADSRFVAVQCPGQRDVPPLGAMTKHRQGAPRGIDLLATRSGSGRGLAPGAAGFVNGGGVHSCFGASGAKSAQRRSLTQGLLTYRRNSRPIHPIECFSPTEITYIR